MHRKVDGLDGLMSCAAWVVTCKNCCLHDVPVAARDCDLARTSLEIGRHVP